MNIQIEHQDDHTVRLTVDVDKERLTKAMDVAARKVGKDVNIPGFRKGKAPVPVVLRYVGEQYIMEQALEVLGNEVYREALDEAKIEPYAPGNLEDVKTEPSLSMTFSVPKRPVTTLPEYREMRFPLEIPEVDDKRIDEAIRQMQESRAVTEPAARPSELGDQVKAYVVGDVKHPAHESEHAHEEKPEGETTEGAEEVEAHEHEHEDEGHIDRFVDREYDFVLTPDKERDLVPGFSEQVVGLAAGEEKEFSIAFPEDYEDKSLAGHSYTFKVSVKEINSRTLPTLDDEFAKLASSGEVETLADLRARIQKDLHEMDIREAESKLADDMMNKIVEGAEVKYPEAMIEEYTTDILNELDRNLRDRGLSLQRAMQIQGKDEAAMRSEYRDAAISRIKRGMVLREVILAEGVAVTEAEIDAQIDAMTANFSQEKKEATTFRRMLNQPDTRRNIEFDLVMNRLTKRMVAIAKGENPPVGLETATSEIKSEVEDAPKADASE